MATLAAELQAEPQAYAKLVEGNIALKSGEGLKIAGAAESFKNYLGFRGQSKEDPLLAEIRKRAGVQQRTIPLLPAVQSTTPGA